MPRIHRPVEGHDAAEGAGGIGLQGLRVGLDQVGAHRHAARVGVLHDHAGRRVEALHALPGGVGVGDVVVRELLALQLLRRGQRAGGRLAFGTDWPVVDLDPRPGIHTALTRRTLQGKPEGGFVPEQRLPLEDVLDAWTAGSAYASFEEERKGRLAPGMLADLVVLSEDIFKAPASRLASTRVDVTIFDGRVVYRRTGATTN